MIGSDIPDILELSGIKPGDMIVLHADAIVCAQFKEILPEERIDFLIDNIRFLCPNCYLSFNGYFKSAKHFCK